MGLDLSWHFNRTPEHYRLLIPKQPFMVISAKHSLNVVIQHNHLGNAEPFIRK